MKNLFSKIFFTMMLAFAASAFVACDKNNDDDESQNQESTPEEVGVEIGVEINASLGQPAMSMLRALLPKIPKMPECFTSGIEKSVGVALTLW